MSDGNADERMRAPEAARYTSISASTLAKLRVYGGGPAFLKLGRRTVVYERSALDSWLNSRRFESTSDYQHSDKLGQ